MSRPKCVFFHNTPSDQKSCGVALVAQLRVWGMIDSDHGRARVTAIERTERRVAQIPRRLDPRTRRATGRATLSHNTMAYAAGRVVGAPPDFPTPQRESRKPHRAPLRLPEVERADGRASGWTAEGRIAGDAVAEKELGQRGHGLEGRSSPAESGGKDLA